MKKTVIAATLLLLTLSAGAQEVSYSLPKTTITVEVGYAQDIIHAGKYANKSQEEQITITCSRTLDDAINNLQTKFEDFRVYTPITEVIYNKKNAVVGVVAPIGLKEGVAANKKYSMMQCTLKRNGRTVYTLVDNVKVAPKANVWDNRYAAGDEDGNANTQEYGTQFATKKNVMPGFQLIETSKKQK